MNRISNLYNTCVTLGQ